MSSQLRVLLVEDNPHDVKLMRAMLASPMLRANVTCETTLADAMYRIERGGFEVILLDLSLPDAQGLETVRRATAAAGDCPVVVLTGLDDREVSLHAVHEGAQDYLIKSDLDERLLERSIRYAIERQRTQVELRVSEERYALAARGTEDGLWDWDVVGARVFYSERWCQMLGLQPVDVGDNIDAWFRRVHPDDRETLGQAIDAHVTGQAETLRVEYRIFAANGTYRWMLARAAAVRDARGFARRVVGSQTDITPSRVKDPLTDLPNRALFEDRVVNAMQRARRDPSLRCAVLVVDLDRFRTINESYGHSAGDEVLVEVAERLRRCVRSADTVARFGGDTFHILLQDFTRSEIASRAAARIQTALSDAFTVKEGEAYISACIGLAIHEGAYSSGTNLLRDAEIAVSRAKKRGKGEYEVFDPRMQKDAARTLLLETDLRRALDRDELTLVYQPIFDLETKAPVGFEALLRWEHQTLGEISPAEFIPLAEDSRTIVGIGRWVLGKALRQLARWTKRFDVPGGLTMHINVSAAQFSHRTLVDDVRRALRSTEVAPENVQLELTETALILRPESAAESMKALRALKVGLALDDFGTGYSSLNYLHRFPFDVVKLDRSFVDTVDREEKSTNIVHGIVELTERLGLEVVAEGVETESQRQALLEMGCRRGQGYLMSKPIDATAATALLATAVPRRPAEAS